MGVTSGSTGLFHFCSCFLKETVSLKCGKKNKKPESKTHLRFVSFSLEFDDEFRGN